jgi:hypothetical protein
MARQAKDIAPWILLGIGTYVVMRWVPTITPNPDVPGADSGSCGSGPFTVDGNQARAIADAIHSVVYDVAEDEAEVARLLMIARTDGDVCRIIKAYGNRRLGLFQGPYTLPQIVSRYLNESAAWTGMGPTYIDQVNSNYQSKNISFRF